MESKDKGLSRMQIYGSTQYNNSYRNSLITTGLASAAFSIGIMGMSIFDVAKHGLRRDSAYEAVGISLTGAAAKGKFKEAKKLMRR